MARRAVIDVDVDLHQALKVRALADRVTLRVWVARALRASLNHAPARPQGAGDTPCRPSVERASRSRAIPKAFSVR